MDKLRKKLLALLAEARQLVDTAEAEDRDLTEAEQHDYDTKFAEAEALKTRITRMEKLAAEERELEQPATEPVAKREQPFLTGSASAFNKTGLGDTAARAFAHYARTGDIGGVKHLRGADGAIEIPLPRWSELRASNDTSWNITTAADGGNAVPTGFVNMIASRLQESLLATQLGVREVPGTGTTVNFPVEGADANAFVATSEQNDAHTNNYDRDAGTINQKAFTLVKYTKKLELTEELLDDEDAALMNFIADYIGRAMATLHNSLLLTEVGSNGTLLKTFASATAIAAGEPEDVVFNDTLGYYLDDNGSVAWVMRPTTFGTIASITGNSRLYAETPGGSFSREVLGYPVLYSNQAAAIASTAKSVYFGNWYHVGYRQEPRLRLIRDPYSVDGMTVLKYSFRTVYGVLQAGAVGYGQQAV